MLYMILMFIFFDVDDAHHALLLAVWVEVVARDERLAGIFRSAHEVDDGGNHNEFRIGVNLGAGAEFALGRNWAMNVEFRYQLVDDFDQGVINFGAAYRF